MNKQWLSLTFVGLLMAYTSLVHADTTPSLEDVTDVANVTERKSYSYIGIGLNTVDYQENTTPSAGYHVESDASGPRLAQRSGGYIAANEHFGFYINSASMFGTATIEETWKVNGVAVQENEFSIKQSELHVLMANQLVGKHYLLWGVGIVDTSFTRFNFSYPAQNVINVDTNSENIGEDISQIMAYIGYEFNELYLEEKSGWKWQIQTLLGLPLISETLNNKGESTSFSSSFDGYLLRVVPTLAYQINKNFSVGLTLDVGYNYRSEDSESSIQTVNGQQQRVSVILPENTTLITQPAVSAFWSF